MHARRLRVFFWAVLAGVAVLAPASPASANPIPLFPITKMVVTFDSGLATFFFIDNLAFGIGPFENLLVFDEVPFQSVNGLTVMAPSGGSVTFAFTVGGMPSADAYYNAGAPGIGPTYLQYPMLEGTTSGVLTMLFDSPAKFLSFGLALDTSEPGIGATVSLFLEDGTDLSTIQHFDNLVEVESLGGTSEGRFSIPSPFGDGPEPGSAMLVGAGLAAAALWARRRHSGS